jgi:hypothetical protein
MSEANHSLRHYARIYTDPLYSGKNLDEPFFARLKNESYRVLAYVLQQPAAWHRLIGPRRRDSIKSLPRKLLDSFSDSLKTEFHWATAVLVAASEELKKFIELRKAFEEALLTGQYGHANSTLNDIESQLGYSCWGISCRLLLSEQENGLNANRTQLVEYINLTKDHWLQLITTLLSERCEKTLCPNEFEDKCAQIIANLKIDDILKSRLGGYICYRFDRTRFNDEITLPFLLHFEERLSLIDRLIMYVFVSTECYLSGQFTIVPALLEDLFCAVRAIPDSVLQTIGILNGVQVYEPSKYQIDLYSVIDLYTRGRYADAAKLALQLLLEHPSTFELYELLVKSDLRSNSILPHCFQEDTLAYQILTSLYALFSRSPDLSKACHDLRKLGCRLSGTLIGPCLSSLYNQTINDTSPDRNSVHWILQATEPTPRLSLTLPTPSHATLYLSRLAERFPNNASIELFNDVAGIAISPLTSMTSVIPSSRRLKYRATILERNEDYGESLALYEEMSVAGLAEGLDEASSHSGTMRCLIRLNRISDCVIKLVRIAVRQPTVIPSPILAQLLTTHPANIQKELSRILEWPTLYGIAHRQGLSSILEEDMYALIDDYLTDTGVYRPTDLQSIAHEIDSPTLIYFLRHICIPDVLESSPWYDSLADLMSERIAICEWLSDLDSTNRTVYATEIADLRRAAAMRDLSQKGGHSKIFVDTHRIKRHLPNSFIDRATRCLAYWHDLSDYLRQSLQLSGLSNIDRMKITYVDSSFDMFKSLFNELSQQFITSNEWGLDSNLSQRIRHGVLSGAIRPLFESHHLITQRDAAGSYLPNDIWINRLCELQSINRESVSDVLEQLSAGLDDIVGDVRNSWLQIKSPAKSNGYFDYDFADEELLLVQYEVSQADSPDSFITRIFDALWKRTEANLAHLRLAITDTLSDSLKTLLDKSVIALEEILNGSAVMGRVKSASRGRVKIGHY